MYYERYSKIRDERGLTDAEVSKQSEVAKATMSNWKSGKYTPKTDKLRKIAAVLGVTVDDLIEEAS